MIFLKARQTWALRQYKFCPGILSLLSPLILGLGLLSCTSAQTTKDAASLNPLPQDSGKAGLDLMLRRLSTTARLMHTTAHPDDEDGGMMTVESRGKGDTVLLVTLNRGEGGQNLIGSEQGAELGLIRTNELLDARKIDGAEQFFTRAIDFGFSKTATETLEKWGRERILADVVWVIRKYRPDVIVLVFTGTPRDGHPSPGHDGEPDRARLAGRSGRGDHLRPQLPRGQL